MNVRCVQLIDGFVLPKSQARPPDVCKEFSSISATICHPVRVAPGGTSCGLAYSTVYVCIEKDPRDYEPDYVPQIECWMLSSVLRIHIEADSVYPGTGGSEAFLSASAHSKV